MKISHGRISQFTKDEYDHALSLLSPERQAAVLRMRFENDRKRSVLGEFLTRCAISESIGIDPKSIKIARTENGKPYCENADLHFSIGHSKDLVVCALHDSPVGVDVEFIRPLDLRITKFACTEKDMKFINRCEDGKELRFFKLWTAKEAYIKYHGRILADLKTVDYEGIAENCENFMIDEYMVTVYRSR